MADDDLKTRIVGESIGGAAVKLIIASIIVGAVFSFVGLSPREFWSGIITTFRDLVARLGNNVAEIATTLGTYFFIGAAIVIPIYIIARLFSSRR